MNAIVRIGSAFLFTALLLGSGLARGEGSIGTTGGPHVPFAGCFYYEHDGFRGERREIPRGISRKYVGDRWNDRISSIACSPGCGLQVWEHRDFSGARRTFPGGTLYVGDTWNDRISSMKVAC